MKVPDSLFLEPMKQELLDVDELKMPSGELLALIQDAIAVAEGFQGKGELSLLDHQPCAPRAMLAALIYCYLRGIYGSEQIEEAFKSDEELRAVSPCRPDRELLRQFRRIHREVIQQSLKHLHWFLWTKYGPLANGAAPTGARAIHSELAVRIESESGEHLSRAAFMDKMTSDT